MGRFWKHEAHLNTVVEIQPTDYVDLGQYDSREGDNMGSNAKYILNVNPARFPDTLDMNIQEREQSMKISRFWPEHRERSSCQ